LRITPRHVRLRSRVTPAFVPGQHDHGAALTDVARPGREVGEPSSTPTLAMTGEMMLDNEELAEAQSIGRPAEHRQTFRFGGASPQPAVPLGVDKL
jgi:hypothetical protein